MESILTSIKKQLGITEEYTHFDTDIVININTSFMTLRQLGVGPAKGFAIKDAMATWSDFIGDSTKLEAVKTYVYLKAKLVFDPPPSASVIDAYQETLSELEWRLNVATESEEEEEIQNGE